MAQTRTLVGTPVWVDLAATDAGAARAYYEKLFGWKVEVSPDPQYGGYGMAKVDGKEVAGIGPKMNAEQPTVWQLYIGVESPLETDECVRPPFQLSLEPLGEFGKQLL